MIGIKQTPHWCLYHLLESLEQAPLLHLVDRQEVLLDDGRQQPARNHARWLCTLCKHYGTLVEGQ